MPKRISSATYDMDARSLTLVFESGRTLKISNVTEAQARRFALDAERYPQRSQTPAGVDDFSLTR